MPVDWIHRTGFFVQIMNLGFPQITGSISDCSLLKDFDSWKFVGS
jgi:hypothetical protein